MDYQPPPFFSRGPAPLVRLGFFVCLAVLLMVLDARFRYAESLRQVIALLAYPLQRVALAPGEMFGAAAGFFTTQVSLKQENEQLKAKQLLAANELLTVQGLRSENAQLRRLLEARERLPRESTLAEILYTARNPFTRKIVVDKGLTHSIQAGMPVIDATGVVGQVTSVGTFTSEVTLVTEKDQSVPVMLVRNGLRAVAVGSGKDGSIDVPFMPVSADVQSGDLFVTSGIDGTYPPGLPVAKVSRIEQDAAYSFAKIICVPTAGTDQNRQVLVLSREMNLPAVPVETESVAGKLPKQKRSRNRE
jgi:rod shape-determining protein MreC